MDPRETPDYRVHRALSTLNSIDTSRLAGPDRERIAEAITRLEHVDLLSKPGESAETTVDVDC